MHGVPGVGADVVAWMSTALDTEQAMADRVEFILSLLDIWKCFDQIVPLLVHTLAALAGMTTGICGPMSGSCEVFAWQTACL